MNPLQPYPHILDCRMTSGSTFSHQGKEDQAQGTMAIAARGIHHTELADQVRVAFNSHRHLIDAITYALTTPGVDQTEQVTGQTFRSILEGALAEAGEK